jgi:hypothetical protein
VNYGVHVINSNISSGSGNIEINGEVKVDIKSLISGVYIVEIINQTSKTTFKINKL